MTSRDLPPADRRRQPSRTNGDAQPLDFVNPPINVWGTLMGRLPFRVCGCGDVTQEFAPLGSQNATIGMRSGPRGRNPSGHLETRRFVQAARSPRCNSQASCLSAGIRHHPVVGCAIDAYARHRSSPRGGELRPTYHHELSCPTASPSGGETPKIDQCVRRVIRSSANH